MKKTKAKPRVEGMTALALKAMKEAVAEVYADHARLGLPVSVWDDEKGKVVWIKPKQQPRKPARSARARRNARKK